MPRRCSVCAHPKRDKMESALAKGVSYRKIAERFKSSISAVARHATVCVVSNAEAVAQARVKKVTEVEAERVDTEVRSALSIEDELYRCFQRINLIFDACDQWMRDPNDPTRYTLDPRADEVFVVYLKLDDAGKVNSMMQQRASLHSLLALAGVSPVSWEAKLADPRVLILKTAEQLGKQIDLLAKLQGAYKAPDPNAPYTVQLDRLIQIVETYRK